MSGFDIRLTTAITQFPQSVIDTITGAMSDTAGGGAGDASGDALASVVI